MEKENKKEEQAGIGGGLGSPFDSPGMATVSVGPYVERLPIAGKTVGEIRKRFKAKMDIDDRSQPILDGEEVDASACVREGQVLMFIHKAGEKGSDMTEHEKLLANENVDMGTKVSLIKGMSLAYDNDEDVQVAMRRVIKAYASKKASDNSGSTSEKEKLLDEILRGLETGPFRVASYVEMLPGHQQARVIMDDGTIAYTTVAHPQMVSSLKAGDEVLLDKGAHAVLFHMGVREDTGEEAKFERHVGEHIEVTMRNDERYVYRVADELAEQIKKKEVEPGDTLVVSDKKKFAYRRIPPADALSHYRYLVRERVPDVTVERDIGNPPRCIQEILEHIAIEMTEPQFSREFGVRRSQTRVLAGVSGSGKSLAIQAICNGTYQVMSMVSGAKFEELPPRIFRLRMSDVLSCYLGESDKNLARFFREVEQMAGEPVNVGGQLMQLPVIAIIEEMDGLARRRGEDHSNAIYDHILTTALQWLDPVRPELNDRLITYIGTTNEPDVIDRAFLRRIGGNIDRFHRLDKPGFEAVLSKHLAKVPVDTELQKATNTISTWLWSDNRGVELKLNSGHLTTKYRRDMLTGALVDRAVQDAAKSARNASVKAKTRKPICMEELFGGFEQQFQALLDQLTEENAGHYVDLPEGTRVASLRRLPMNPKLNTEPIKAVKE